MRFIAGGGKAGEAGERNKKDKVLTSSTEGFSALEGRTGRTGAGVGDGERAAQLAAATAAALARNALS